MKTFTSFTEKKRTDQAVLISAFVEETGKNESFFLPLSVAKIEGNTLSVDEDFWKAKLLEVQNLATEKLVVISTQLYELGEKSTKVSVSARLKSLDRTNEIWLFLPNSKIEDVTATENKDGEPNYEIRVPQWVYESALKNALEYQLNNFWNKDKEPQDHYMVEDFTVLNDIK
ncbi:hypothetical protein [Chryseobacterium sp.]|uniref:hypothetical protein n=1 Tax=Chryseobacterium sp. TaxID=1871047 RepID=UPI0012A882FC|nr:hypothetical protein [Chryseobacterium sp.]QFG54503.1 hypothetical protein F7R58_12880 [Chryseobacterium sp.]